MCHVSEALAEAVVFGVPARLWRPGRLAVGDADTKLCNRCDQPSASMRSRRSSAAPPGESSYGCVVVACVGYGRRSYGPRASMPPRVVGPAQTVAAPFRLLVFFSIFKRRSPSARAEILKKRGTMFCSQLACACHVPHTHARARACTHARLHACVYARPHARARTRPHAHTRAHFQLGRCRRGRARAQRSERGSIFFLRPI